MSIKVNDDSSQLPADMVSWIESATGGKLAQAVRIAGGGRKQAWLVDIESTADVDLAVPDVGAEGTTELYLRWDPTEAAERGDVWTVQREAEIYRALHGTNLPVAQFVALHPNAAALLLTRLSGASRFSQLRDETERNQVAADFIRHLAALHRLDPCQLGLLSPERKAELPELVREQLAELDAIIEFRGGPVIPVLRLALDWLRDNVPAATGPIVLVHGDSGPGNFLFEDGRVSAIVDWELAHLGDPMDDIAWVMLRSLQDPFTDLDTRFGEYERASGIGLDMTRIRYYRVLAEAKILVMSHGESLRLASKAEGGGPDPGARLIFAQLHQRLCAESLADVLGLTLIEAAPISPAEQTDDDVLFDIVLAQLREIVTPRVTDSLANQRIKGLARVLKYLSASARSRTEVDAAELADLHDVLGDAELDLVRARARFTAAVAGGSIDPAVALQTVYGQLSRRNELLRSASGALADRHYDNKK